MADGRRLRNKTSRVANGSVSGADGENDAKRKNEIADEEESIHSSSSSSVAGDQHWVQCENPDCLKWRIILEEDAENLDQDASWFCHMNTNVLFSSCDVPEEKYKSTNKMKKHGLTYTFSLLPEGSLVWARLPGYCKWPAVLCHEPGHSDYFILDHDGDPHSYHVEFLGTKHSIAWVNHTKIDAYGNLGKQEALETCSQPFSQISMNRFRTGKKKRKHKRICVTVKKKTGVKLAEQLQAAIDEADDLLELSEIDRLEKCQYRIDEEAYEDIVAKSRKVSTDEGKAEKKGKKIVCSTKQIGQKSTSHKHKKKKSKPWRSKYEKNKLEDTQSLLPCSQQSKQLSQNKLTDFSSKEERLIADIQGLQSLEQEFNEDYKNIMGRKRSTTTSPKLHGCDINLFQLYMAVQEKGGFNEVCVNMKWKEIVMECCDLITNKYSPSTAMAYYSRHLLPYEIHVNNGGSEPLKITKQKRKRKSGKKEKSIENTEKRNKKEKKILSIKSPEVPIAQINEDEALKELEEMEELLNEFQDELREEKETEEESIKESSMNLCYNDESQKFTTKEFEATQLFSQSQKNTQNGVDCSDIFGDVAQSQDIIAQSQVAPQIETLQNINQKNTEAELEIDYESGNSEEDLFAEIDQDEELLRSLLDSTV